MLFKPKSLILAGCLCAAAASAQAADPSAAVTAVAPASACPALLQHTFPRLQDEKPQALCQYAGKVLLVVNTASYCGFTGQYKGLEALHQRFGPQGLVVLGFPSNDFGNQEPGSAQAIADFCENTFGVKFPMFSKTRVRGAGAHPFYRQLGQATGEVPTWNFHKYLIDRQGRAVMSFASAQDPQSPPVVAAVQKLLQQKP